MTVTNPTLSNDGSKVFSSSGSSTLTLYGVQSESISKNSNMIEFPIPTQDSNKRLLMDLLGASRSVSISGVVSESDIGSGNLYKYVDDLVGLGANTLVNGDQKGDGSVAGYTYTSEVMNYGRGVNSTFSVYVMDVSATRVKGETISFAYQINLIEADGANSV